MKHTTTIHITDETWAELCAYAKRRDVKLSTAVAYAVRSGLSRLLALKRYRDSPRGRRAARLAADRAAERKRR